MAFVNASTNDENLWKIGMSRGLGGPLEDYFDEMKII